MDDNDHAAMSPQEVCEARHELRLSLFDMATMLGYIGAHRRDMVHMLETGRRPLREAQRRLIEAYLAGYRPPDWHSVAAYAAARVALKLGD